MKERGSLYKANQLLLFGFLFFGGMYFAKDYLIPLFIAALLAMLLLPVCKKLESWKLSRSLSIIICLLLLLIFVTGLIFLLGNQIATFSDDYPVLKERLQQQANDLKTSIAENTNFTQGEIQEKISSGTEKFFNSVGSYLQTALTVTGGLVVSFFLILIYIGFFLGYRDRIEKFILKIIPEDQKSKTQKIIKESKRTAIAYLSGIVTVLILLAVCNIIFLSAIGLEHAIFFAILAAFLNLIPFLGSILGSVLPMIMALITQDSMWIVIGIGIYFIIIQYVESYIITPFIVGGKVKVNPLAEILALVLGGIVWGIAGLILFVPLIGLVKVIFDRVDSLKPFGYLIGREESGKTDEVMKKSFDFVKRIFGKK